MYFVGNNFNIANVNSFSFLEYLDLRFPQFKWRNKQKNLLKYWNINKDSESIKKTKPITQIIESLDN